MLNETDRTILMNMAARLDLTVAWQQLDHLVSDEGRVTRRGNGLWRITPIVKVAEHNGAVGQVAANALRAVSPKGQRGYTHTNIRQAKRVVCDAINVYTAPVFA